MDLIQIIKNEEDMFPKTFVYFTERDYGILFYNADNKDSYDSNHAVIFKDRIQNLSEALKDLKTFYLEKNLTPRIYQSYFDEGYFEYNKETCGSEGFDVQVFGYNSFMLLSADNLIVTTNKLTIKELNCWDERIANDICIPSNEKHEIGVIKGCIECDNYRVFVGYLDNKAVAVTYFHISENCCRFDYILISEKHRCNGYAREILSYATDYCRLNNIKNCYQWPAHKTSEKICYEAGFRELFKAQAACAAYNE